MSSFNVDGRLGFHSAFYAMPRRERGAALGLWLLAGTWCARNSLDGFVPAGVLRDLDGTPALVRALVGSGLLDAAPELDGFWLAHGHDPAFLLWKIERTDYRKKIPKAVRRLVHDRDGWRCTECGAVENLTLDHVYPWSLGGSDFESNLQTLCQPCNRRKGARV